MPDRMFDPDRPYDPTKDLPNPHLDPAILLAMLATAYGGTIKIPLQVIKDFNIAANAGTKIEGSPEGLTITLLTMVDLVAERTAQANAMIDGFESLGILSAATIAAMRDSVVKMKASFDTARTLDEDITGVVAAMDEFLSKMKMARERHYGRQG